jgi:hypothetical protein
MYTRVVIDAFSLLLGDSCALKIENLVTKISAIAQKGLGFNQYFLAIFCVLSLTLQSQHTLKQFLLVPQKTEFSLDTVYLCPSSVTV